MSNFKHNIIKKKLSWEIKKSFHNCDHKDCLEDGKYKAPKSRINLYEYYLFCLKHVKDYNKSWDFYKGLNVNQIELSIRKDTVWNRPSWPLKGNPNSIINQLNDFLNKDFSLFENEKDFKKFLKNKILDEKLTTEQHKSLKILELSITSKSKIFSSSFNFKYV